MMKPLDERAPGKLQGHNALTTVIQATAPRQALSPYPSGLVPSLCGVIQPMLKFRPDVRLLQIHVSHPS
jgi:hypothetical protein